MNSSNVLKLLFICLIILVSIRKLKVSENSFKIRQNQTIHPEDSLQIIKALCGELCDLEKNIENGDFLGTVRSKVDCDNIFEIEKHSESPLGPPLNWSEMSDMYKKKFKSQWKSGH